MTKSQTAGWASDSPTPAQLKELFAQIDSGRITKDRLQGFLRGALQTANDDGDWFTFETTQRSLVDLLQGNRDVVYQEPWWKDQQFAREKGQAGRKIAIRTSAAPESFTKTWDEQQKLLQEGEFVPTARDLAEGVVAYYRSTGKKLFTDYWVRTQDVSSDGRRVLLGWYSAGLCLVSYWGGHRYDFVGLAVARNAS